MNTIPTNAQMFTNALKMAPGQMVEDKPNPWGMAAARALGGLKDILNKPGRLPIVGGAGDLLMGDAAGYIEDLARGNTVNKGAGFTTQIDPRILDVIGLVDLPAAALGSVKALRGIGKRIAELPAGPGAFERQVGAVGPINYRNEKYLDQGRAYTDSLPNHLKRTVGDYASGHYNYQVPNHFGIGAGFAEKMNSMMRGQRPMDPHSLGWIEDLRNIQKDAPQVTDPSVIWRGGPINENQVNSTTINPELATTFGNSNTINEVLLEPGTPLIGTPKGNIHAREMELLINNLRAPGKDQSIRAATFDRNSYNPDETNLNRNWVRQESGLMVPAQLSEDHPSRVDIFSDEMQPVLGKAREVSAMMQDMTPDVRALMEPHWNRTLQQLRASPDLRNSPLRVDDWHSAALESLRTGKLPAGAQRDPNVHYDPQYFQHNLPSTWDSARPGDYGLEISAPETKTSAPAQQFGNIEDAYAHFSPDTQSAYEHMHSVIYNENIAGNIDAVLLNWVNEGKSPEFILKAIDKIHDKYSGVE